MKSIESLAEKFYSKKLPYHNFEHALRAVEFSKKLCKRCKHEGILVDEDVIEKALLFHDAGYHKKESLFGFKSKEEYAAFLAKGVLKDLNFSKIFIKKVEKAILATRAKSKFKTNEEKIVRASDLAGLAGKYEEFFDNSLRLKEEWEIFSKKKISWDEWKEKTRIIVEFYLAQDIQITKYFKNKKGESIFHLRAKRNLKRFLKERFD